MHPRSLSPFLIQPHFAALSHLSHLTSHLSQRKGHALRPLRTAGLFGLQGLSAEGPAQRQFLAAKVLKLIIARLADASGYDGPCGLDASGGVVNRDAEPAAVQAEARAHGGDGAKEESSGAAETTAIAQKSVLSGMGAAGAAGLGGGNTGGKATSAEAAEEEEEEAVAEEVLMMLHLLLNLSTDARNHYRICRRGLQLLVALVHDPSRPADQREFVYAILLNISRDVKVGEPV